MKHTITLLYMTLLLSSTNTTDANRDVTTEIYSAAEEQSILSNIDEIVQQLGKILEKIVECLPNQRPTLIKVLNKLITLYIETTLSVDNMEEFSNLSYQEIMVQLEQDLTMKTRKGMDRSTELILHSVANMIGTVTHACINGADHPEIIGASVNSVLSDLVTIIAEKSRKNEPSSTGTMNMNVIMHHLATDPVLREAVEKIIHIRAQEMKRTQENPE